MVSPGFAMSIAYPIVVESFPGPEPTYHVVPALTTSDSKVMNPIKPAVTSKHTLTTENHFFLVSTLLYLDLLFYLLLYYLN